ncbi:uncharacterized protein LOC132179753 isoform X3 [Corylus avellana]|uniref:uncharacterized protein LOC132179753 isoform X3 n=1 Tax=Corylus avellana TaxID=13451 RepID=UPI00286CAFCA|nr:uncharacterized protein LOC132179753 isoform X3 [Corylus avellana]
MRALPLSRLSLFLSCLSSLSHEFLYVFARKEWITKQRMWSEFHEMCAKVGVDPLASSKGFWASVTPPSVATPNCDGRHFRLQEVLQRQLYPIP